MKRFRSASHAVTILLAVSLGGCDTISRLSGVDPIARRPNDVPATELRINPELAEGQRVFMEHCNQCHVGGAAGVGPALNNKPLPAFLVHFQVRNGLGAMPAFSTQILSDGQIDDIATYLRYLRRHPDGAQRS